VPAVHRVASLAKRWLLGTHQGAIDDAHLADYLDGLQFVRNRLHSPGLVGVCDEGPLAETRAVLLDTTCRALVVFGWAPEQYFLECGDMFPSAPDTIADENAVPLGGPAAGEVVDEQAEGAPRWPQAAPDDLTGLDDEPGDGCL
jgi:hypothetical protein